MSSFQPRIIMVYIGGFSPFHIGHMSSYRQAKEFANMLSSRYDVYFFVGAGGATASRPYFTADEKTSLMFFSGVRPYETVKLTNMFTLKEILYSSHPDIKVRDEDYMLNDDTYISKPSITFDKNRDILLFVRSDKEKEDDNFCKMGKVESIDQIESLKPFGEGRYCFVSKKENFSLSVSDKVISSATQLREIYKQSNNEDRKRIVDQLYPRTIESNRIEAKRLLDQGLIKVHEPKGKSDVKRWRSKQY
jgi:glycerol-3-phosphate cytidylyltransferase-like family protein